MLVFDNHHFITWNNDMLIKCSLLQEHFWWRENIPSHVPSKPWVCGGEELCIFSFGSLSYFHFKHMWCSLQRCVFLTWEGSSPQSLSSVTPCGICDLTVWDRPTGVAFKSAQNLCLLIHITPHRTIEQNHTWNSFWYKLVFDRWVTLFKKHRRV